MSVWVAFAWGGLSSSALLIGQALAGPLDRRDLLTGLIMGFGAGTLLSAVAYELIPQTTLQEGLDIGIAFVLGALVYYAGDRIIDSRGGADRQQIGGTGAERGSGAAMFLGALLDGVPEAFILGTGPVAGTSSLKAAGYSDRHIFWMWTALTLACACVAALGFIVAEWVHTQGSYAEAFAAGAVLTMLANSMMPEAFQHGGRSVGLVTVLGFLVAGALSVLQ